MSSTASKAGRIGVWGASGSGKSTYVKQRLAGRGRVVFFDPLGEYDGKLVDQPDQIREYAADHWKDFRVGIRPVRGKEPEFLKGVCEGLMEIQAVYQATGKGRQITLVVEEMNLSFPVNRGVSLCPAFADICSRGRHYGIEVFGLSQRIAEVDTRFRGNCTETVVFRQKGPRDQQAAAAELGCRVNDLPSENLHFIREMSGKSETGSLKFSKKISG